MYYFVLGPIRKINGAFKVLVINGYEEDSQAHLRILLEQAITLLYILLNPEERIQQYNDYCYVDQHNTMAKVEKYRPFYEIDYDKEEIIQNYERVKDKFKSKNRWSNKNLREMAKEVGKEAEEWYEFIYSWNSSYVHSDIYSLKGVFEHESLETSL
ncbi:DUF5677 domain-containing protein [Paenibacillus luteus]|uniref:DUF5677 domain-containing protein n=1 Tax=Paenibacillus luteus TaxID=2545753 RepID=UPI0030C7C3AF